MQATTCKQSSKQAAVNYPTCVLIFAFPAHPWYVPADLSTLPFDPPNNSAALLAPDFGLDFASVDLPIHPAFGQSPP